MDGKRRGLASALLTLSYYMLSAGAIAAEMGDEKGN